MGKSSLGDTQIINNTTRQANDKGFQQLRFELPSGRVVTSEFMPPSEIKGKVILQWCGVIRDQDEFDITEREQKEAQAIAAKRMRQASSPAPRTEDVPVPGSTLDEQRRGSAGRSVETLPVSSPVSRTRSLDKVLAQSELPEDPTSIADAKLQGLYIQQAELEDQLSELTSQMDKVKRAINRWETVRNSLAAVSAN